LFVEGRDDVLRHHETAARGLASGPLNEVDRRLAALASHAEIGTEAALHAGYLRMLRRDWAPALALLDRAAAPGREPETLAIVDYFRGWVFERTDRRDESIAAYQRAYATTPNVQNLSSLLAAQLFLAGRRAEAHRILDASWRAPEPRPRDLLVAFQAGDARIAGTFVRRMREALQ
jgi:tetratricopeptide (TPR) repeat protein